MNRTPYAVTIPYPIAADAFNDIMRIMRYAARTLGAPKSKLVMDLRYPDPDVMAITTVKLQAARIAAERERVLNDGLACPHSRLWAMHDRGMSSATLLRAMAQHDYLCDAILRRGVQRHLTNCTRDTEPADESDRERCRVLLRALAADGVDVPAVLDALPAGHWGREVTV
jgi:hypothetical protein